jgi:hypothetical protein
LQNIFTQLFGQIVSKITGLTLRTPEFGLVKPSQSTPFKAAVFESTVNIESGGGLKNSDRCRTRNFFHLIRIFLGILGAFLFYFFVLLGLLFL